MVLLNHGHVKIISICPSLPPSLSVLPPPDKNPHPDAQKAFGLLSRAFEVLADPATSTQLHLRLRRHYWNPKRVLTRQQRNIKNWAVNLKSNILLFVYKKHAYADMRNYLVSFANHFLRVLTEKFNSVALAPSFSDRVQVALLESLLNHKISSAVLFSLAIVKIMRLFLSVK